MVVLPKGELHAAPFPGRLAARLFGSTEHGAQLVILRRGFHLEALGVKMARKPGQIIHDADLLPGALSELGLFHVGVLYGIRILQSCGGGAETRS